MGRFAKRVECFFGTMESIFAGWFFELLPFLLSCALLPWLQCLYTWLVNMRIKSQQLLTLETACTCPVGGTGQHEEANSRKNMRYD